MHNDLQKTLLRTGPESVESRPIEWWDRLERLLHLVNLVKVMSEEIVELLQAEGETIEPERSVMYTAYKNHNKELEEFLVHAERINAIWSLVTPITGIYAPNSASPKYFSPVSVRVGVERLRRIELQLRLT
ncbi:MAG: hypothetical protein BJ554DRAFT_3683 [Olpidium bornovanus]|uniref:Uncharacterized protein n=1 Tax=Olpidium bornovanus TaxID=278681 RepID=A0A8H7ZNS8_9FUNG|nr:MAG: hypothetical protein BJ554DRAFT_3683 [Olpidium bornovanus]